MHIGRIHLGQTEIEMSEKPGDRKRLLLELATAIREDNRNTINPILNGLSMEDLHPVINMTARARGAYLKELFSISKNAEQSIPTNEQIKKLRTLRITYEELVTASKALETAIERGYLDVS